MNENTYSRRAEIAYFKRFGPQASIPSANAGTHTYNGKSYVVLDNIRGPLAVYRITSAGGLRYVPQPDKAALREWGYDVE